MRLPAEHLYGKTPPEVVKDLAFDAYELGSDFYLPVGFEEKPDNIPLIGILGRTAGTPDGQRVALYYEAYASLITDSKLGDKARVMYVSPEADIAKVAHSVDALLLTGGSDVDPAIYGETIDQDLINRGKGVMDVDSRRDEFEGNLLEAIEERIAVFGVCRGLQLYNVHMGGTLLQGITPDEETRHYILSQSASIPTHGLELVDDVGELPSDLRELEEVIREGKGLDMVNSVHHQRLNRLGAGMQVIAVDPVDKIPEVVFGNNGNMLGVQFHPELLRRDNPIREKCAELLIRRAVQSYEQRN